MEFLYFWIMIVIQWHGFVFMKFQCKYFSVWFLALRAYSIPISVMSWIVPFLYALLNKGNIIYGIIALIGIVILHLGTNIFDDFIDYLREKNLIEKGLKETFNFQKGKCFPLFNNDLKIRDYFIASFILFFISYVIALFFINQMGLNLLYVIIPSVILCLLYPILGCLGFGELIVALIFSPLLYSGVYYVMTEQFSLNILIISVSTGLLSVAVLHNHMLLDYEYDEQNRKTTLCRICKTPQRALYLLGIIVALSYINIIAAVILKILSPVYLITILSLPSAITLYSVMSAHIKNPNAEIKRNIFMGNLSDVDKAPDEAKNFMLKFIIVRNLLSLFTSLILLSIVITKLLKCI